MGSSNTGAKDASSSDCDNSSRDHPASDSGIFSEGERVLAYHGLASTKPRVKVGAPRYNGSLHVKDLLVWEQQRVQADSG